MKPKIIAVFVVALLTLSVVATGVAAISQAVAEDPGASSTALGSYGNEAAEEGDSDLTHAFKLVCPFH